MAEKKVVKRKGIKNVRKTKKRSLRSRRGKKSLREVLKAARVAIAQKSAEAGEKVKKAVSVIDKMAQRRIIHANKAARLKSRLQFIYQQQKVSAAP
jgi:small subunit ribosomal protein S20